MSEAKFTKGEWKANGRLIYSGSKFIATASVTDVEWKECEANAALIATAPEMYEMLEDCYCHLFNNCSGDESRELISKIIKLRAKSRGEQ